MSDVLRMEAVTRSYGKFVAVLDVHMSLQPGVHGLLGPNGAGKTTLLRLAAGLLRPSSGTITWRDGARRGDRRLDNAIAICLDGEQLPGGQSPLRLLTFLLRCAGASSADATDCAERSLLELGLGEQLHRPISALSRGQRQRVKLAQALALPSELLLLDEPLNALDPVWRLRVTDMIKARAEAGACVVMSSHVLAEVEAVATRLLLLFKGRVVAAGTQAQIHELVHNRGMGLTISCDAPRKLAAALLRTAAADSTRIDGSVLFVESADMAHLCTALPAAVLESGAQVSEVRPEGDDLVGMFTTLSRQVR